MKKIVILIFLILISIPVIFPLLKPGFFPTHDGEWAVVRLAEMHRELRDLQIPPQWSSFLNHGFGYPLFLFTYPLPYYLGEIFNILGFGLVGSIKILFFLSVVLSGTTMFLLVNKLWGKWPGLISAIFYLYLPFRMVNLYVRGSIGESLAFILYPLLFWLGINLLEKRKILWVIATGIGLASLVLVHNIMALVFIPFWFAFMVIWSFKLKKSPISNYQFLLSIVVGFFLSAFFWLPAIIEKQYVIVGIMPISNIKENFVNLWQLIIPSWGYGVPNAKDAFSYQIGWVHVIGFVLGILAIKKQKNIFGLLLTSVILLIILMMPASLLFWHFAPLYSAMDFPWRLLGVLGFFVSLTVGAIAISDLGKKVAVFLSVLVILVNIGYAKPRITFDKGDNYYSTNDATTTSFNELMPVWVKIKPTDRQINPIYNESSNIEKAKVLKESSLKLTLDLSLKESEVIYFNKIYFPMWGAKIDGKEVAVSYNNERGLISIPVPFGQHLIELNMHKSQIRILADNISFFTIFALIIALYIKRKDLV